MLIDLDDACAATKIIANGKLANILESLVIF
jgi:hypothetical protein